jgi:hypothetical protein
MAGTRGKTVRFQRIVMRNRLIGVLISALAMTAAIELGTGAAYAAELWDTRLRGIDEGASSGALPPAGVYGVVNNFFVGLKEYDANGKREATSIDAIVVVPVVLWQTGYQVFGADYAVGIAQPFDYTDVKLPGAGALSANGHWGTYNTILIPALLSWKLDNGLHLSTGLSIYLDDASSSPGDAAKGGGCGAGNGYMSFQPDVSLSWLEDGWNLSISAHYAFNLRNTKTDYTSGQELAIDYTATKAIGKWTVGIGAFTETQLTDDSGAGATAKGCAAKNGCKVSLFGIGPLIAYQFGGLELMAEYNVNVVAENDVAGDFLNIRLVAPL